MTLLIIIGAGVLLVLLTFIGIASRIKKCSPDQILVVFGKTGGNRSSKCVQGGAAFIWPIVQGYKTMSLQPLQFECNLKGALSSQNIRVDVPSTVTVAISTEPTIMMNAAERLLMLDQREIENLVRDIVYGQIRTIVSNMSIEDLNSNRDEFLIKAKKMIDSELQKVGMYLLNINITDIRDEAGYIVALGKKDQAIALNNANAETAKANQEGEIRVAEQNKIKNSTVANTKKEESIALANATKEREIALAEAEREQASRVAEETAQKEAKVIEANSQKDSKIAEYQKQRDISVATSKADARIGEVAADKAVAISEAELDVVRAEARGKALSANETASGQILKSKELAQKEVAEAAALKIESQLKAEKIVPAEIEKEQNRIKAEAYQVKLEKEATADANATLTKARAAADAIALQGKAEAEAIQAKGLAEATAKKMSLMAEADGFRLMMEAAESNPALAIQYKMVSEYRGITEEGVKAFQKMDFGNVVVMDTAGGDTLTGVMKKMISTVVPGLEVLGNIPQIQKLLPTQKAVEMIDAEAVKSKSETGLDTFKDLES